jgi:hypothetical protein
LCRKEDDEKRRILFSRRALIASNGRVAALQMEHPMKSTLVAAACALAVLAVFVPTASRAGCLTGAAVGGVAGHLAGHHAVLGAAAGCAVGHHEANKAAKAKAAQQQQQPPQTSETSSHG